MALGPASYEVWLDKRGGEHIALLPWSQITWRRALDDMSDATVTVPIGNPASPQAHVAAMVNPWEHEVSIWRPSLRWCGPVQEPEWTDQGVSIPVKDLFVWFERRNLTNDRTFTDIDLGSIFTTLAEDAMRRDPSPHFNVSPQRTGVIGSRSVVGAAQRRAADELRELARNGIDFSVIGRSVVLGGREIPTRRLPTLTNDSLTKVKIKSAGTLTASEVAVTFGQSGGAQAVVVGGVDATTGLLQRTFNESAILDARSAGAAAQSRWDSLHTSPLYVTGELVAHRAPDFDLLVPGAVGRVAVSAGVRSVDQSMRLSSVAVSVANQDGAVTETVTVEFIPLGTVEGGN